MEKNYEKYQKYVLKLYKSWKNHLNHFYEFCNNEIHALFVLNEISDNIKYTWLLNGIWMYLQLNTLKFSPWSD